MVRLPRRKSDALVPTGLSVNPEPKTGVDGKHNHLHGVMAKVPRLYGGRLPNSQGYLKRNCFPTGRSAFAIPISRVKAPSLDQPTRGLERTLIRDTGRLGSTS